MAEPTSSNEQTRCGFVALIGPPNAGKSTLMNALVGTKVSIVTHKVQTTRALIRGIMLEGTAQVIFVDTPGLFDPKDRLQRAMVGTAWTGAADADMVALILDARKPVDEGVGQIVDKLATYSDPKLLILNKTDVTERGKLLELAATLNERCEFQATFMISALTEDGLQQLRGALAEAMPAGPWLYPEDQISDLPMRQLAAEVTREKLFLRLHQELPYASTIETESWQDQKNGSVRIEQCIYVRRDSQKKIVIGKGGQTIKAISAAAREELSEMLERPVHLFLFVKVRENWVDDPERYREIGLEYPS